jgi:ribosome-associated protein
MGTKNDLFIEDGVIIPDHELEITASRAGGPGGQHVNKTSTRISVRWNVKNSQALDEQQKERVMQRLQAEVTSDGDIIVSHGTSRSQQHNKKMALAQLAQRVRKALHVPKKRMATVVSAGAKEARLKVKKQRSNIKKMRSKKFTEE